MKAGGSVNKIVTSKAEVLRVSRELIQTNGWASISIRAVAAACDVSVGTIYNYFDSKSDLISATIESVWCDIFHTSEGDACFQDIVSCITWLYQCMEYGSKAYPGFFSLHSTGFMALDKKDAIQLMKKTWAHISYGICATLKKDPHIRPDAFDASFTPDKFSQALFSLVLADLMNQHYDPEIPLQIIRRCVY